jgi:hypothetical protein
MHLPDLFHASLTYIYKHINFFRYQMSIALRKIFEKKSFSPFRGKPILHNQQKPGSYRRVIRLLSPDQTVQQYQKYNCSLQLKAAPTYYCLLSFYC